MKAAEKVDPWVVEMVVEKAAKMVDEKAEWMVASTVVY